MNKKKVMVYGVKGERLNKLSTHIRDNNFDIKIINNDEIDNIVDDLVNDKIDLQKSDNSEDMEFLLFVNIKDDLLYDFLAKLREDKLLFPHKAILTETNRKWKLRELLKENKEEHAIMTIYANLRRAIITAEKLLSQGNKDSELEIYLDKARDYISPREFDYDELKGVYNDLAVRVNFLLKGE